MGNSKILQMTHAGSERSDWLQMAARPVWDSHVIGGVRASIRGCMCSLGGCSSITTLSLRLTMLQMEKHVCQWIRKAWTAKRRCSQDGTRTNVFNVRRRIAVLGLSDSDSFLFGLMPSDEIPSCCLVAINFDAECSLGRG